MWKREIFAISIWGEWALKPFCWCVFRYFGNVQYECNANYLLHVCSAHSNIFKNTITFYFVNTEKKFKYNLSQLIILRNFYGWQICFSTYFWWYWINFLNFCPEKTVMSAIWKHRRYETYARDLLSHFWYVQNVGWRHPPSAYSFRQAVRRVRTRQENSVRVSCQPLLEDTWGSTHTVSTSLAWLTIAPHRTIAPFHPIAALSPSLARPPIAALMKRLPKHLANTNTNTTKHQIVAPIEQSDVLLV